VLQLIAISSKNGRIEIVSAFSIIQYVIRNILDLRVYC
jgi:hypothetical protein